MLEQDKKEFAEVIRATFDNYHREQPMNATLRLWWEMLAGFDIAAVRGACLKHIATELRYAPTIGQLLENLRGPAGADGRLGADEAWAKALIGLDESETVVTTPEIMEAFAIARPVLEGGDEVGARMAFKDSYNRIVAEARSAGKPVARQASLGWDPQKREYAVSEAVNAGLLPAPTASALLPPPAPRKAETDPEGLQRLREAISQLKPASQKIREAREAASAAERAKLEDAKRETQAKVDAAKGDSEKAPQAPSF
ncbi:replicative helicase loader/inhibitor [Cupriavidus taiwanensis]|uniref:replicative helicase loader/inhibitor n=1 Tax=Cupriavidus taiwanensis TaxID=164546 RepID=UPI000E1096DF|nr:replicative helicase loader/inhibitor [Cupriavidus taiwanensis]SOY56833.1 conserved hypothetical protein [Cupriavidus taiwanensis]SOY90749.1 conserved hypothetical protein [Cupriavidus taiwanensis]SOZ63540.1 conserved hypothetical protein [Cupriavidus taiwanensis]SOZ82568.1 conserved hypothetical protein [Cupriavidus taiwanensis]SOZ84425.1 conserved hypothetical protein [Cupriavidus taiwanensis]